jgi:hypothetical protein
MTTTTTLAIPRRGGTFNCFINYLTGAKLN